jgi:hypothetical protein
VAGSTTNAAVKGEALRRAGVLAGLLAGPILLVSVGLNTWASVGYLHQLAWEFVCGEQVPWPSSLARGPYGWAQIATFVITGLLIVILAVGGARSAAAQAGKWFRGRAARSAGVALILAGFRVDVPMLNGGNPETWNGWVHAIAFLLIIATGLLAPLTMALAGRGDASWRPITVMSLAASPLIVVFLILPWGNASLVIAESWHLIGDHVGGPARRWKLRTALDGMEPAVTTSSPDALSQRATAATASWSSYSARQTCRK